ncbi:hypothetical protein BVI434_2660003 [Burkholderia vietnamiensis]|nr:hypothetical protein BVI434_2660003 [Burkholderia vietnamiensis]
MSTVVRAGFPSPKHTHRYTCTAAYVRQLHQGRRRVTHDVARVSDGRRITVATRRCRPWSARAFRRLSTHTAIPAPLHTFADFIEADAA